MSVNTKLRGFVSNKLRGLTYYLLSKYKKSTWVHIPEEVIVKFIERLHIAYFSYIKINGEEYPLMETREMKFIGPPKGQDISCLDIHLQKYRNLSSINNINFSKLDNEHVGLLHNIVIRYVAELSSFPYIPLRTENLSHGSTFVDIGAFRGYLSLKAAKKLRGSGKVYCIEPILDNSRIIQIQKDLNNLDNLTVLSKAVSLQDEDKIKFYRSFNQINSEIPNHVSNDKTTKIDVGNISVEKLCELIIQDNPTEIFMSITTNGTEIDLSKRMIEILLERNMPIKRIVIPILYTEEEFNKHKSFFSNCNFTLTREYPWCIIENNNSFSK